MHKYEQKWAIIALLEDKVESELFTPASTPLHVTLAGVFKIDKSGSWLANNLQSIAASHTPIDLIASRKALFGTNSDVTVSTITPNSQITSLHNTIYTWLHTNGATFNEPQYQGEGFLPHITYQQSGHYIEGDTLTLNSLSLVDLFPGGDGDMRKIIKTIYS